MPTLLGTPHEALLTDVLPDYKYASQSNIGPDEVWYFTHTSNDGRKVSVSVLNGSASQYKITVHWPWYNGTQFVPNGYDSSIKISYRKEKHVMRTEIYRRLLESYDIAYPQQMALSTQARTDEVNRIATMREFATMLETTANYSNRQSFRGYKYGVQEVQPSHNGTKVQLTLYSLPYETAKKVVELLKKEPTE